MYQTQQQTASRSRRGKTLTPVHPVWKKITPESIAIRAELKANGCHVKKLPKRPVWTVTKTEHRFELHYLPHTEDWILLPTTPTAIRDRLMLQIEKALAKVRSGR